MIIECIELNWSCKHMKKVRSRQAAILVLNRVKHSFSLWVSLTLFWLIPNNILNTKVLLLFFWRVIPLSIFFLIVRKRTLILFSLNKNIFINKNSSVTCTKKKEILKANAKCNSEFVISMMWNCKHCLFS